MESGLRSEKIMRRFEKDPMVVNSYFPKHAATELCNRSLKPAGQSFVSFAERKFCLRRRGMIFVRMLRRMMLG